MPSSCTSRSTMRCAQTARARGVEAALDAAHMEGWELTGTARTNGWGWRAARRAIGVTACGLGLSTLADIAAAQTGQPPGIRIGISYVAGHKTGLAVLPIDGADGDSIATMLRRDFDYSDRFTMVNTTGPVAPQTLNYDLFRKLAVDGVVQGALLPGGALRITLHDVAKGVIQQSKDFPLPSPALDANWRQAIHVVADQVEEWITQQRGIAATRIAFERSGRIWTVDSDGANLRAVSDAGIGPQWTPSGRHLLYSVNNGRDPIIVLDVATGAKRTLTSAPGAQDFTPAVSPDGRTVVFARTTEEGTDIYTVPFEGGAPRRVSVGRGRASVGPTYAPDGRRLAFSSDRTGHNEIYVSDDDGSNVEQLTTGTFGDRENRTAPDWSPDGGAVAYASLNGGTWQIMVVNVRDQSTRQVTSEGRNQDPSWAPDARHIVITSHRSGNRQLWVVDTETGRSRQLTRGAEARLAAWSPRFTGR